jgi:hypothetical protein
MFALGHIHFKNYTVWVIPPVFTIKPYQQGADELSYYEVLLTEKGQAKEDSTTPKHLQYNFYIDIATSSLFKHLLDLNERNQPIEGKTDMVQYQSYLDRKSSSQPLYKLSKKSVERLLQSISEAEA